MYLATSHDAGEAAHFSASPLDYARRLARYVNDPSAIRAACINHYGRNRPVPSREVVQVMIDDRKAACADAQKQFIEESAIAAPDFAPRGLVRKKAAVVRTYDVAPITAVMDHPNPFMQRWRLSAAIMESAARFHGLTVEELQSETRVRRFVHARAIAIKLMHESGVTMTEIGRRMGGRDHSTISNSIYRIFPEAVKSRRSAAIYKIHARWMARASAHFTAMDARDGEA